jgi:hypothetical protein
MMTTDRYLIDKCRTRQSLYEAQLFGTTAMAKHQHDPPPCAECGGPVEAFGNYRQLFHHPKVMAYICTKCAQTLTPEKYAMALALEQSTGPFDPDRGL